MNNKVKGDRCWQNGLYRVRGFPWWGWWLCGQGGQFEDLRRVEIDLENEGSNFCSMVKFNTFQVFQKELKV